MIIMTVADDECVHLADVDLQQLEIICVHVWRETEVEKISARLRAFARFEIQRQPPLALQRLPLWCLRKSYALDLQTWRLGGSKEEVVRVVGDLLDCNLVDNRSLDPNRRGVGGPIEQNATREQRSAQYA